MEQMNLYGNILLYSLVTAIVLGAVILIGYGVLLLVNSFIDDYKDGEFWFSPKDKTQ